MLKCFLKINKNVYKYVYVSFVSKISREINRILKPSFHTHVIANSFYISHIVALIYIYVYIYTVKF